MLSLLDNDLYKFTMQQAVLARYPQVEVEYRWIDRDGGRRYPESFVSILRDGIWKFQDMALHEEEFRWLQRLGMFSEEYLGYLREFCFDPQQVRISVGEDEELHLAIRGPWKEAILWEVPLLAWIQEQYYTSVETDWDRDWKRYYLKTINKGADLLEMGAVFSEFGTRRRRGPGIQEAALRALKAAAGLYADDPRAGRFTGSSNVHFCRLLGLDPVGTMAHEWIMAHEALFGLEDATPRALRIWLEVHGGRFDVALTDTFTLNLFFRQFSADLARRYRGLRHDSGDAADFVERALQFYGEAGIDPSGKVLFFSDGIERRRVQAILDRVAGRIGVAFGIGTWLTNDFPGSSSGPVIKLYEVNGEPAVKTTSDPAKATGDRAKLQRTLAAVSRMEFA